MSGTGSANVPGVDPNTDTHFMNPYHLPEPIGGALITVEGATSQTTLRKALVGGANTIVGVQSNPITGEILFIRSDGVLLSIGNPVTLETVIAALTYTPYPNNNPASFITAAQAQAMISAAIAGGEGPGPGTGTVWLDFSGAMWLWPDGTPILSPT